MDYHMQSSKAVHSKALTIPSSYVLQTTSKKLSVDQLYTLTKFIFADQVIECTKEEQYVSVSFNHTKAVHVIASKYGKMSKYITVYKKSPHQPDKEFFEGMELFTALCEGSDSEDEEGPNTSYGNSKTRKRPRQ